MKSVAQRVNQFLFEDDLFRRVCYFFACLVLIALGVLLLFLGVAKPEEVGGVSIGIAVAAGGVLSLGIGGFYSGFVITKPSSSWYKSCQKRGLDVYDPGDAFFLLIVLFLPAVLVTCILRLCGIRGYDL